MANFRNTKARFESAKVANSLSEMEAVYTITDDEIADLDKKEETQTVDPSTVQRWNMLHDDVCTMLNRMRKQQVK